MKKVLYIMATCFLFTLSLFAQDGECILIIQGDKDDASEDFNTTTDALATGFGSFPGPPNITVLRPTGEASGLGAQPARSEQNYTTKADLLARIKAALCNANCKNVVIAINGHGMGGNGIEQPPPNKSAGGVMIADGNPATFLLAEDLAKIIDECQKSVKILAGQCYGEAMTNGILDSLKNKHLVGVSGASSKWNEPSVATDLPGGKQILEWYKYFLEDYYLIIGNPNTMEELRKNAEEVKKKNAETNAKIAADNAALATKIAICEAELADLKARHAAAELAEAAAKKKKEDIEMTIKLLEERVKLEEDIAKEKDSKKLRELRAKLTANTTALKLLGIKLPTDGTAAKRIEKLNAEIEKQKTALAAATTAYNDAFEATKALSLAIFDKEFMLEELKKIKPQALIPDHLPLMELVIHEAFKSAKAKTKHSHPTQGVIPNPPGTVEVPKNPPTESKIGDNYFVYYKVIDKKTNKCHVVGYRRSSAGVPIGPIKSIECNIDCSLLKFSYNDNGTDKVVEATKTANPPGYKYKVDGMEVANVDHRHRRQHLIAPGSVLGEAYCKVLFNTIPDVQVPGWNVSLINYDPDLSLLGFNISNGFSTHQVLFEYLQNEDVLISIDQFPPYLGSQTRLYTLLDQEMGPAGKLGVIEYENNLVGNVQSCRDDLPIPIMGAYAPDEFRYMLFPSIPATPFMVQPVPGNNSLMSWVLGTATGILQPDAQNEPMVNNVQVVNPNAPNKQLIWQYNESYLNELEQSLVIGVDIIVRNPMGDKQVYHLPKGQNFFIDPMPSPPGFLDYQVVTVLQNTIYCVPYESPFFNEYSLPVCMFNQVPSAKAGIKEERIEHDFYVSVAPNPFSSSTDISFNLENSGEVMLDIFSTTGKLVKRIGGNYDQGLNKITIGKEALNMPGMYIFTLKTPSGTKSGKVLFIEK